jgi:uncharacterized membrane protein YfcA
MVLKQNGKEKIIYLCMNQCPPLEDKTMNTTVAVLIFGFFFIALIYSSVGFGGGSSYLAILGQSFLLLSQPEIKATALFCNIIVVIGGTIIFYRDGKLSLKEFWPYLVASVPMAYIGGYWRLHDKTFYVLLGVTLVVAAFLLWLQPEKIDHKKRPIQETPPAKLLIGGAIGLLSGLVSIGGGIFLSPILHFLKWSEAKKISALASVFFLVNSIGGLAGQFQRGVPLMDWSFLIPVLLAVFFGGQIGSRLGARKFNPLYIKRITAVVIFIAGANILFDHLT